MIASKLIPVPEAVLISGAVGTGGLDEVQAVEAEGGNAVTRELFASHIGVPDDACPWSSNLYLLEALLTVEISSYVFRGVLAEMVDENDWPSPPPALLWVLDTGFSLELWYDIRQRPRVGDPAHKMIRNVIGHHEDAYGDVHYAVLWEGYLCPGWI
ncbi:hypothetical protein HC256_004320 [Beauveria bassiana]|nr:hypothetical protein HC256_004320 [Beauveria bassiana]